MRWRGIALVLAGLNVLWIVLWLSSASRGGRGPSHPGLTSASQGTNSSATRINLVARRPFIWTDLESDDYSTFIANLRDIGCPEQTIRDIIIADVNSLFARRRATELVTPEQQWWRSDPDSNTLATATIRARNLEQERRALLSDLLGANWESGDLATLPRPSRTGVNLDGQILGTLPVETKQAVQNISVRSQDRLQAYLDQVELDGKTPDPAEIAKLRQQTRFELAGVLNPFQLEEFLLRYSENANALRYSFGELEHFNPSQDEFRAVFRATDTLDQQIAALAGQDANSVQARRALETQRENAIKLALGSRRYEEYLLFQDPLYRQAYASAQAAGTPEAVRTIYHINLAAAAEQDRIQSDTNLTAEQRGIENKQLELDQLKASTFATGRDLPPELPPIPTQPLRRTYTYRTGDSLATVSMIFGVSPQAIRDANPNLNFSRLRAGQAINIPRSALTPPGGP